MAKDLIGPSAFGAANPAAARPAIVPGNVDGATDTWFQDCTSPTARDGTSLEAAWMNFILAQVRSAVRGMGVVESNLDDDMLLKAIQAATASLPAHTHPESDVINLVSDLAAKLALSGGTMTGELDISYPWPALVLNKPASGTASQILGKTAGVILWNLQVADEAPQTGGNTGANFGLHRFDDTGTWLGGVIQANRATGDITLNSGGGSTTVNGTLATKELQVSGDVSGRVVIGRYSPGFGGSVLEISGTFLAIDYIGAEKFRFTNAGEIGLAGGDVGTVGKVLASNGSGVAAAWKTLAELGVGKKIIAIGAAYSYNAVSFPAEPDTGYSVLAWNGVGTNSSVNDITLAPTTITSKTTTGFNVAPGGNGLSGGYPVFYIVYR